MADGIDSARVIVDDAMVERALRVFYGDTDVVTDLAGATARSIRAMLEAAVNPLPEPVIAVSPEMMEAAGTAVRLVISGVRLTDLYAAVIYRAMEAKRREALAASACLPVSFTITITAAGLAAYFGRNTYWADSQHLAMRAAYLAMARLA